jgi:Na+-transporting methylmalonyl-CoA/oxaloacetate decarboxylase gamma subunit
VDNYTEGVAIMIIGMGVVFLTLAVLATFTGVLERLFRPREARPLEMSHENLHDDAGTELEELAMAAVAVHLMHKQKQQAYAPLGRVSEQWKLVGRFKSLRR